MRFLERLDDPVRDQLLGLSQIIELRRGQMLVRRGERSDDLYLVRDGSLEVVDTRSSPELILSTVGPGAMVGEMAFFDSAVRTADVRAASTARCHRWSGEALKRELAGNPTLAAPFYQALAALLAERARNMASVAISRPGTQRAVSHDADTQQQAHGLVSPARTAWIDAERALRTNPDDPIAQAQIRQAIEKLLSKSIRWISGKNDPAVEQAAGEALSREMHPFLTRSRTGSLSLEGGEARRVAHILLNERRGVGPLGESIDQVLLSLPTSVALRRRTSLASQTLLSRLPDAPVSLMALNVFSGVVLNRIFQRLGRHGAAVTCLDGDREALASVDLGQSALPSSVSLRLAHTDLAALCMGRLPDQHPKQDFILADGLMDYLPDQLAAGALAWCRDHLKPSGLLLLTGTAPCEDAPVFDYLLDWPMLRRPARDLRALADSVGLRGAVVAGGGKNQVPAVVVTATRPT